MGRKLLIPRKIDVSSSKPVFLGRTAAGARSLRGRQIRHEKAGLSGDRQIGTSWHVFPAGARQSDDAAHTAIMIQEPTERPMNAGDKPSQASWWRAPGNTEIPKMQQNRGALRILAQSPETIATLSTLQPADRRLCCRCARVRSTGITAGSSSSGRKLSRSAHREK